MSRCDPTVIQPVERSVSGGDTVLPWPRGATPEVGAAPVSLALLPSAARADQRLAEMVLGYVEQHAEIRPAVEDVAEVDVVLVLARALTEDVLTEMVTVAAGAENPAQCMVLVTGAMCERRLARVIACGVVSILPCRAITPRAIAAAVLASAGGRSILSEHATRWLIDEARAYHELMRTEFGVVAGGLTVREAEVLRLLAEGQDTAEIAGQLHYSERTIKKIIQDMMSRLNLRNRTHAVSYAMRAGAI